MGRLQQIQSGKAAMPPRILVFGIAGVGKSTLASQTPKPIFIQTEDGLGQIDCHRFPLASSFDEVMASLAALYTEEHDYQTLVVDSLDWLERLIWEVVCRDFGVKSIEKADGGFSKGYVHALTHWHKFLEGLVALHSQKRMMCLLLAHAKIERFEDPESAAYDRYSPRLHGHACALLTEWVDAVLFATRRIRVETQDAGFNRERGIARPIGKDGGERVLRTVGGPACVAKNRYDLDAELPLDWNALWAGIARSQV